VQGELEQARRAHAQYFSEFVECADPELRRRDQLPWRRRLEAEHDNLRAALRWLLDDQDDEQALRLAGGLGFFWWLRGYYTEGSQWLEEALSKALDADPIIRTWALLQAAPLLASVGDHREATARLQEALALARTTGDRRGIALSLTFLGSSWTVTEKVGEGQRMLQEALALWEELGDDYYSAYTLASLAVPPFVQGQYQQAAQLYAAGIARYRAIGELTVMTTALFYLALVHKQLGDHTTAVRLIQDGLTRSLKLGDRWPVYLGTEATLLLIEERVDIERRASLLGATDTLSRTMGLKTGIRVSPSDPRSDPSVAALRARVERGELEQAHRAGCALSFEGVVALALELLEEFAHTLPGGATEMKEPVSPSRLSAREQEVLRLVAEGLTSKQIGQQLFLSHRTVDHHLTAIFNKLGVDTRAQAVAVATRDGLL
jgi:non-specific serine/threonine protein kinase